MDAEIIKKERVELKVKIGGMLKRILFKVIKKDSAFGPVYFLSPKEKLPYAECLRLAQETSFPILNKDEEFYPPGKTLKTLAERFRVVENDEKKG